MTTTFDARALADSLTIEEASTLLHGKDFWRLNGVPRLNVPAGLKVSDGPNGARGQDFVGGKTAACFPCGVALGATFDVDAAYRVGQGLAAECRTKSAKALLGPTINIHRSPLGGRNFESYSEDPFLSGKLASGYVRGLQGQGIASVIKHFICNDEEKNRRSTSAEVDEATLREIYLRPFQIAFREASPKGVMTSYNKVNGIYTGEDIRLIQGILREEWGQEDTLVVSDWWAVYSLEQAVLAGLDLEMPNSFFRGDGKLIKAAKRDPALADAVKRSARRILEFINHAGGYELEPEQPEVADDNEEIRALIRSVATDGQVLLKNASVLPLSTSIPLLVTGNPAVAPLIHGGGSASLGAHRKVSILDGLKERFDNVTYAPGVSGFRFLPSPDAGVTSAISGNKGSTLDFVNPDGFLVESRELSGTFYTPLDRLPAGLEAGWTAVMRFVLKPQTSGRHALSVAAPYAASLSIDGEPICETPAEVHDTGEFLNLVFDLFEVQGQYDFEAGRTYNVEINYQSNSSEPVFATGVYENGIRFGYLEYQDEDAIIAAAVKQAEEAGTVVVCVGHGADHETEGTDRETMALLGRQNDLVASLGKSSARTIVVVNAGSPISMPWLDSVDAVVYSWFPGQELGHSVADILSGIVNPSGRLPVTFPKKEEDTPCYADFPGANHKVVYSEGTFVGYRHYTSRNIATAFPFGYGLSYTSFKLSDLDVQGSITRDSSLQVRVKVENTGRVAGRHVVLAFVRPQSADESHPSISLEGFAKTALLQPGQEETVTISLDGSAFSRWQGDRDGSWVVQQGDFNVEIRENAEVEPLLSAKVSIGEGWNWRGLRA